MFACNHWFLATILPVLLFSSASRGTDSPPAVEEQLQSLPQANTSESAILLYQTGQCPTIPKPGCDELNCQGHIYVGPMQYRCEATTVFSLNGRDVTLVGCRCCPIPLEVRCIHNDCHAPVGTRLCDSEKLGGCACETDEDRRANFHRDFRVEDIPVLAEREMFEDLIEINDDGILGSETQTRSIAASITVSPPPFQTRQEPDGDRTGAMALPTLGFDLQQFRVTRDAQVLFDVLESF